jgi:hypothetical protein
MSVLSVERPQVAVDLYRYLLYAAKAAHERSRKLIAMCKVTVVCSLASNVPPDGFGGVVLGRVFRQGMGVPPAPLSRQPALYFPVEVIRRVVVNVVEGPRIISPRYSLQKPDIGSGIEDWLEVEQKAARVDFYAAKHFNAVALACHRYARRLAATGPGLGPGRVLPKAGFVLKDQGRCLAGKRI